MRHCVAGSTSRCWGGRSAIFSVRFLERDEALVGVLSVATVEVDQAGRKIVQIKEPRNTHASRRAMQIIEEWAAASGLLLG